MTLTVHTLFLKFQFKFWFFLLGSCPLPKHNQAQLHSAQFFSGDLWWTSLGSLGLTVAFQFFPQAFPPYFFVQFGLFEMFAPFFRGEFGQGYHQELTVSCTFCCSFWTKKWPLLPPGEFGQGGLYRCLLSFRWRSNALRGWSWSANFWLTHLQESGESLGRKNIEADDPPVFPKIAGKSTKFLDVCYRRYIFKWLFSHGHISFRGCKYKR